MELKVEANAEFKNNNKLVQYLFKKEERVHKLIISLLILSLIAGIETTLLLYSADQKGMNVLNGMSISEIGVMSFAINTIVMGALGLLVTFIIQIIIVCLLFLFSKERSVNIKGICQAVINAGICIVVGSGVNAIIALLVKSKETTFTSLSLLVHDKTSILHTLMAEFELFYIVSLILFSYSLEKLALIKRKKALIITIFIALISLVFHMLTVASGTYLK
ncbi:hypothetical protein OKW24_005143 [Peribacillus simplex]|uniref:hypothetical protein n=1 Tax=Peribacillus simplex TaxID=1478 RepID=UPI0024E1BBC1|nr:hypothetical protein [Peribacillus simplex]MDF9763370.1 hypothetical protein [Peribacillus simplex]